MAFGYILLPRLHLTQYVCCFADVLVLMFSLSHLNFFEFTLGVILNFELITPSSPPTPNSQLPTPHLFQQQGAIVINQASGAVGLDVVAHLLGKLGVI